MAKKGGGSFIILIKLVYTFFMHHLLLGIFDTSTIETVINNLTEVDIAQDTISLVMNDEKTARDIIADAGPLHGVTVATLGKTLQQQGVDTAQAEHFEQLVAQGKALLAVSGNQEILTLARSICNDYDTLTLVEV